jgi:hypothetical protein
MSLSSEISTALEDARVAVRQSSYARLRGHSFTLKDATQGETQALRDAVLALIQAVEVLAAGLPGSDRTDG